MRERCDACCGEASVRMDKPTKRASLVYGGGPWPRVEPVVQVLLFCGHHARRHAAALTEAGWVVGVDEREWAHD